jgi:hypothetical protein
VKLNRFKDGKKFAITLSYDDGNIADRRLVKIFNDNGLKATFNLNSSRFDDGDVVSSKEISTLYKGHEIACHCFSHPHLERLPLSEQNFEIYEDKKRLEQLTGYIVRGFAYPYGSYSKDTETVLKANGICYARTTVSGNFFFPADFLYWSSTCHHLNFERYYASFTAMQDQKWQFGSVFYIWGHSYEFDRNNNWDLAERMSKSLSEFKDAWFCTNIELYDYATAQKNLVFSADNSTVFNNSLHDIWITGDSGDVIKLDAGKTTRIK